MAELNRAVAVGLADGPAAGLAMLEPLLADPALERYQLAARGPRRAAEPRATPAGAVRAYERAIALTANAVERAQLERRLRALRRRDFSRPSKSPSALRRRVEAVFSGGDFTTWRTD